MAEEKEFPSDKADKFVVRFPDGMRDHIKQAAEDNNRSMNSEIIERLQRTLQQDKNERDGLPPVKPQTLKRMLEVLEEEYIEPSPTGLKQPVKGMFGPPAEEDPSHRLALAKALRNELHHSAAKAAKDALEDYFAKDAMSDIAKSLAPELTRSIADVIRERPEILGKALLALTEGDITSRLAKAAKDADVTGTLAEAAKKSTPPKKAAAKKPKDWGTW